MPSSAEPAPAVPPGQTTQAPVSPLSISESPDILKTSNIPKPALLSCSVANTKHPHDALSSVSPIANAKPLDSHVCSKPPITDIKPLDTEVPRKPTAKSSHIYINGKIHEGGGQVICNAVTLAALTSHPLTIYSIHVE